jgi:hypothetical protein
MLNSDHVVIKWLLTSTLILTYSTLVFSDSNNIISEGGGRLLGNPATSEDVSITWFYGVYPSMYIIGILICFSILIWITVRAVMFFMTHYANNMREIHGSMDFMDKVLQGTYILKYN